MIWYFTLWTFVLLSIFDAAYTAWHIPQVGLHSEMNPLIRALSRRFGNTMGIYLGVLIPTFFVCLLGIRFHYLLTFLLGARVTLAAFQIKVLHGRQKPLFGGGSGPEQDQAGVSNPLVLWSE